VKAETMKTVSLFIFGIFLTSAVWESARSQQPLLSPRDSVEILFSGKKISVNYGRPSMRGRKIMGGLVPFNKWWRTGANEATAFVTQADLVVGRETIPKGSYTIYTMPSEKQWKLMVNKQTGQWGTIYNPDLDLVRLPLKKKMLKNPVEKFLITLEKTGSSSGVMKLTWEKTELSLNFQIKKSPKANPR
jgi:hypothetical protein